MIAALHPLKDLDEDAAEAIDFGQEDRDYLNEITHVQRRRESLAARVALRDALARAYGDDTPWTIYRKGRGKTFVRRADRSETSSEPAPHVSLAHSKDAAIAVVTQAPCGVDIERIDRERLERPWARLASAEERAWCARLLARERPAYILASWTLKEAWAKVRGDGLAHRAREIAIDPHHDEGWRVRAPQALSVFHTVYKNHALTIVVDGPCKNIDIDDAIEWTRWPVDPVVDAL